MFTRAHTHAGGGRKSLFDVRVVAAKAAPVTVLGGLKVVPTDTFATCPAVDVLVVPGGPGKDAALRDTATLDWVRQQAKGAELVTSVCTGSFILGEAGLLDGKRSATHHLSVGRMRAAYPKVTVVADRRVVEDGNVVTAAGVSSGLDMSLRVVARLHGDGAAKMVADIIEYPYPAAK